MFKIISEAIGIAARATDPKGGPRLREEPPVTRPTSTFDARPRLG